MKSEITRSRTSSVELFGFAMIAVGVIMLTVIAPLAAYFDGQRVGRADQILEQLQKPTATVPKSYDQPVDPPLVTTTLTQVCDSTGCRAPSLLSPTIWCDDTFVHVTSQSTDFSGSIMFEEDATSPRRCTLVFGYSWLNPPRCTLHEENVDTMTHGMQFEWTSDVAISFVERGSRAGEVIKWECSEL